MKNKSHNMKTCKKQAENDNNNVVNLTNVHLNIELLNVLGKGLKFVPTPQTINIVEFISNTEKGLSEAPTLAKQTAIKEISTFVNTWKKPKKNNLTKAERSIISKVKKQTNVMFIPADKGGKVVVINKDDYITKIEEQLNDTKKYEQVQNPKTKIKKNIGEFIDRICKQNKIKQYQKLQLNSIEDLPQIRGQIKIHKENHPMRLIICSKNTITSLISQFAFSLIKELRTTIKNSITNTTNLVNTISQITVENKEKLASLDIEDMFTNISITKAVDIAINRIDKSTAFNQSLLTKTDLKKLLMLSLNNNYVEFNEKYYKQKHGLPMDNCLSPILADLYLDDYIEKHLTRINVEKKIYRYVDDILIITKMNQAELTEYVNELNKIKSNIKFTSEFEDNGKINFLDATLTRNLKENKINIRWFRKTTASNTLLNYNSCHQKSIKRNIIKNMTTRIINTTQNITQQKEDINKLIEILKNSNYPVKEIQKVIKTTKAEVKQKTETTRTKEDFKYFIALPYTPGIEVLKRKLKRLKIQLFFSYPQKLQSYMNTSLTPTTNSIVYHMKCRCGAAYIGETKVGLKRRIEQHKHLINKNEKQSNSEIVQHIQASNQECNFNTSRAITLEKEIDWRRRKLKEAIYSTVYNSINKRDDIERSWLPIIHKYLELIKKKIKYKQHLLKQKDGAEGQGGNSGTDDKNT